jgi:glycosyltransferase involved in cell wall biosynthesis
MSRFVFLIPDEKKLPRGGIMNIVRYGELASNLGADVAIATYTGKDAHGKTWFKHNLPVINWDDRNDDDICVIADLYSDQADKVKGACILYMQTPLQLHNNFDYMRKDLQIWTDSPFMLEKCKEHYPGKDIPIVPNVVDNKAFPFKAQSEKIKGRIIVFPRKGDDFIKAVFKKYKKAGGSYWKPKRLHKLPFDKLAKEFQDAQAFLASADVEGCALPPQESMAAGVIVIGKNATGANFSMQHNKTALVCNTVDETVDSLFRAEDEKLRNELTNAAYDFISRYFPKAEPKAFWEKQLNKIE